MTNTQKRSLYESIMNDVAKTVKRRLNEDEDKSYSNSFFSLKKLNDIYKKSYKSKPSYAVNVIFLIDTSNSFNPNYGMGIIKTLARKMEDKMSIPPIMNFGVTYFSTHISSNLRKFRWLEFPYYPLYKLKFDENHEERGGSEIATSVQELKNFEEYDKNLTQIIIITDGEDSYSQISKKLPQDIKDKISFILVSEYDEDIPEIIKMFGAPSEKIIGALGLN